MTDWATLIKNRTPAVSVTNSAHMLECMKIVQNKYPTAGIETVEPGKLWRIWCQGEALSNPHNSHYACWAEAREAMNESGN